MGGQVGFSQSGDTSAGGKGGFGGSYIGPQGPQMGFGMDANTGLPFGSQPQPFGGNGLGMQPAPGVIGIGSSYDPSKDLNSQQPQPPQYQQIANAIFGTPQQPQQPQPQLQPSLPSVGSGGKGGFGGSFIGALPGVADQLISGFGGNLGNQLPPNVQKGFGMPPQGFGAQPPMQAQPINRFAPPNAPGVRQQRGIPVQQARTVQPNRNTRTRLR